LLLPIETEVTGAGFPRGIEEVEMIPPSFDRNGPFHEALLADSQGQVAELRILGSDVLGGCGQITGGNHYVIAPSRDPGRDQRGGHSEE
jgi:hypothetical protein